MVNEATILREFKFYGCEEVQGKVYGYNPVTKKCVDITGYDGPDAPPGYGVDSSVAAVSKKSFKSTIEDITVGGIIDFLIDMYTSGMDVEEIMKCASENKAFSILGILFGQPFVKALPKLAYKGASTAYGLMTDRGRVNASAADYIKARKSQIKKDMSALQRVGDFLTKGAQELPKFLWSMVKLKTKGAVLLGLAGAGGGYIALKTLPKEVQPFKSFTNWVEENTYGSKAYNNWKCFGAVAVMSVMAGIMWKGGVRGIESFLKKGGNSTIWIGQALKNSLFRQSIEKAVKNTNSDQLTIFKILEKAGSLPSGAKVFLDKSGDVAKLNVSGLDKVIRIPADNVPKAAQKYVTNGEIVLDPTKLADELEDISTSITKTVNDAAIENTGKIKGSDFYKRMKQFQKAVDKFGGSPARARGQVLSSTSEILSEILPKLEKNIDVLRANNKNILKNEQKVKKILTKFRKEDITSLDLRKLKNEVLENPSIGVQEIVDRLLPGLKQETKVNKEIVDHLELVRANTNLQNGLITDVEFARKAILGDEKTLRKIFPKDERNINDAAVWLSSPDGKKYADLWSTMGSRKEAMKRAAGDIGTKTGSKLKEVIDSLFENSIMLMSPIATATLGKSVYDSIEETNQTQTNEVKQMSNKDIKELVAEVLNENSGMGYGKYPYDIGNSDDQPAEDYIEEWKALAVSLIKDESRDTAVTIAKILVRDLELFEDVLDLAGQNQSVGSEILRKIKEAKEK